MLTCKIRRLSRQGKDLYVQLDRQELAAHALAEGDTIHLEGVDGCRIRGVVRTKGSVCWLGPTTEQPNREITRLLRLHGHEHLRAFRAQWVRGEMPR